MKAIASKSTAVALLLLAATSSNCSEAADNADDFSVLSQRNMFLRDRRPPPDPSRMHQATTQEFQPAAADAPAKSIVLRGVVIEDDELHAYVEDTRAGQMLRLTPGDAIADGRVASIAFDAIAYEQGGVVRWIDVGQNLFGNMVASPATAPATQPVADGGPAATSQPAGGGLSAIEQRMRERRMRNQRTGK